MLLIVVCVVCLSIFHLDAGTFVEVPISQEVSIRAEAVFRCQHPTAYIINWRVNSSLVGRNPPPGITSGTIRDDNGNLVDTLTITALPEYNGTVVVCVARFDDGRADEQTSYALLLVMMNSFTAEATTEHTIETTIELTIQKRKFLLSPVSLNITLDTVAVFYCQHTTAFAISWRINGTNLRDFSNGVAANLLSGGISALTITALPEYNLTVIVCEALFRNSLSEETEPATMMIQGNLDNVTEIHKTSSTLFWTPPSSLDLTEVKPDIVYCVDIYNITCGRRDLIISDCNITEPSYTPDDIGYIYEYIVTPRSNVEGARNGTPSLPIEDVLPRFNVVSSFLFIENDSSGIYQTTFTFQEGYMPVPSTYTLSLTSIDDLEDIDSVETSTIKRSALTITLDVTAGLPLKRLWNFTLLAYGCKSHPVLTEAELSTHDIQNISVSTPLPGQVRVTGDFIQGSTATGLIAITVSSSEIFYYDMIPKGVGKSHVEVVLSGFSGGQYSMSLFLMEENGQPFERVATKPRVMSVDENDEHRWPYVIEYELQPTLTGVCITCTFLDSSTTDCVAVVHQQISLLSSSGLINIESSHKFSRSGDTAYGCIEGLNLTDYQVGVIGGSQRFIMSSSKLRLCNLWCIIGIVLVIAVGISLTVTISSLCLYTASKRVTAVNSINSAAEVTVDMKRCAAYEVTTLAKQRVVMETNPAYEQVRVN